MAQNRDDEARAIAPIGAVRGMPNLRAVPPPDPSLKGSAYFPTAGEVRDVVRAGKCDQCQCTFYHRKVSSDGVRVLQCVSCKMLYRDT